MDVSFTSTLVVLLLVMDPVGNIPVFAALLRNLEPARRRLVILRECAIAFGLLLFFLFFGRSILDLFGLSDSSLNIAGGVILFLIAIRLIFQHPEGAFGTDSVDSEPFIVPLAIPSIAGPSAIATIVLVVSRSPERITDWIMALAIASTITLLLLLAADLIARHIGRRAVGVEVDGRLQTADAYRP
ncbi:MAG: MarC family protein [Burkholderiales bacterium]